MSSGINHDERHSHAPARGEGVKLRNCPKCHSVQLYDFVRQYEDKPGVADVGWKCGRCGWEFSFDLSPDGPLETFPEVAR